MSIDTTKRIGQFYEGPGSPKKSNEQYPDWKTDELNPEASKQLAKIVENQNAMGRIPEKEEILKPSVVKKEFAETSDKFDDYMEKFLQLVRANQEKNNFTPSKL